MPDDLDLTVTIAGIPWRGWTGFSLSRSIERMGAQARVELTDRPDAPLPGLGLVPGAHATLAIGERVVLDGFIDSTDHRFDAGGSATSIALRDRTGDLVDCAASVDGPFEFAAARLDQILGGMLSPFGIPLRFTHSAGAPFSRLSIQPGETAYEFIERACRYRALLAFSDGTGGLVVTRPGAERAAGSLVCGANILGGTVARDHRQRYSLYVVKGQAEALDDSTASETAQPEGRATDPLVGRWRPTVLMGESQGFDRTLQERAQWEARFARARSARASYKVQGWHGAPGGGLWVPNTLVRVDDRLRGLARDMLVAGVTYERSAYGAFTTLDLVLPEAFDLPAVREPQSSGPWEGA